MCCPELGESTVYSSLRRKAYTNLEKRNVLYSCIDVRHVADAEEHRGRAEDRQGGPQVYRQPCLLCTLHNCCTLYSVQYNQYAQYVLFVNCDMSNEYSCTTGASLWPKFPYIFFIFAFKVCLRVQFFTKSPRSTKLFSDTFWIKFKF